ncbi:MAG: hypothetical protein ACKOWH_04545 [Rhodoluna sp.]
MTRFPAWAKKFSFEVRPVEPFQDSAWQLWKPTLQLLDRIVTDKRWKLHWVKIHSHVGAKRSPRHSQAWVDKDTDTMMLCHFDRETMLHEVAHLPKDDGHSDVWARRLWKLQQDYLPKREIKSAQLEMTRYLSGRRLYRKKIGVAPEKYVDQPSIWLGTEIAKLPAKPNKR